MIFLRFENRQIWPLQELLRKYRIFLLNQWFLQILTGIIMLKLNVSGDYTP